MSEEDFSHLRFEGVFSKRVENKDLYYTAGGLGYIIYVTEMSKTVLEAREKVYSIIKKIIIPKMFYRTDIGLSWSEDRDKLMTWGYI